MPTTTPFRMLWRLLNLHRDQADPEVIDATIRDGAQLGGTNMWVLMFAIVIASVGLNVNSTAVIIGAMLISPLMGPIIGIGYGAGIHDYALIRQAFRNLAIFVAISLFASTSYFLLSPLSHAYSELLARTSPTIWDVLIAFFGGAAGMVGLSRREKTTLIPGVAIATALMPPLCTTGYGLATMQPKFFVGAFYLFLINGVFIALATLAFARILRLPQHRFPDERARLRGRLLIGLAVGGTLIPSTYLAYELVQEEIFTAGAERFLRSDALRRDDVTVVSRNINAKQRVVTVSVIGRGVTRDFEQTLAGQLEVAGITGARLILRHPTEDTVDVGALKRELQDEILQRALVLGKQNAERLNVVEADLAQQKQMDVDLRQLESEARAQLPAVRQILAAAAPPVSDGGRLRVLMVIDSARPLPQSERERLSRWLKARLPTADTHVVSARL